MYMFMCVCIMELARDYGISPPRTPSWQAQTLTTTIIPDLHLITWVRIEPVQADRYLINVLVPKISGCVALQYSKQDKDVRDPLPQTPKDFFET